MYSEICPFLSIAVASYQFVWNGFAPMLWVNRLHVRMDKVPRSLFSGLACLLMPSKECYSEATDKWEKAVLKSVCSSFSC
jgi:hypothetical protein